MKRGATAVPLGTFVGVFVGIFVGVFVTDAAAEDETDSEATEVEAPPTPEEVAVGTQAFATVAEVLRSPRCSNCHPAGNAPLVGEAQRIHAMNIRRRSVEAGLPCQTCHQDRNSEAFGVSGGPPGAPHWALPPSETPMVFQGQTERALCEQLRNPATNGGKDLAALLEHVRHDSLVRWAWDPGGGRRTPPVSHEGFVQAFQRWTAAGAPCP
ncbi:MAG: hypothetical protein AAGF12_05855 [Myxococcota bacterium]